MKTEYSRVSSLNTDKLATAFAPKTFAVYKKINI
jgi:hypothetical protein